MSGRLIFHKAAPLHLSFANGRLEKRRKDAAFTEDTERMNLAEGRSWVLFSAVCAEAPRRHYISVKLCPFVSITPFLWSRSVWECLDGLEEALLALQLQHTAVTFFGRLSWLHKTDPVCFSSMEGHTRNNCFSFCCFCCLQPCGLSDWRNASREKLVWTCWAESQFYVAEGV